MKSDAGFADSTLTKPQLFSAQQIRDYQNRQAALRRCTRCISDESIPGIQFDQRGECNFCHTHDAMELEYPTGVEGLKRLEATFSEIRKQGRGKKYDCIVGVSGGCDSSYLLYICKQHGLRPLAVHFDNTWNSTAATQNIQKMLKALDVDLFTLVVNNREYDDIYRAFLRAGVPDIEIPTDIGFAATLFNAARQFKIPYVIEGHSFRTEGIAPLGWIYMDGKYIKSVLNQFGTIPHPSFPNMSLLSFLRRLLFTRTKKLRPLYNLDYIKTDAMELLKRNFGWEWYGGHHLDNRFTGFFHTYFWPQRFGFDDRIIEISAHIRSKQMDRADGMEEIMQPRAYEPEIVALVKKRLGLSDAEFDTLMQLPKKCYQDYPTYKRTFELLRPFFWLMYKRGYVAKSFYIKYTLPQARPAWATAGHSRE
jgi:N-acetyl sugar amidotransferase